MYAHRILIQNSNMQVSILCIERYLTDCLIKIRLLFNFETISSSNMTLKDTPSCNNFFQE